MRAEWLQSVVRDVQIAAALALDPDANACDVVVKLAATMQPPLGRAEQILAVYFLQRTAWEILDASVQFRALTYAAAHAEYRWIVDVTERTAWVGIPEGIARRERLLPQARLALRIREYLDTHALEKITLARLAHELGCSVRTTTAEFKREYGMSVHLYVIKCRLAEAARLLVTTEMKISAVAEAVGFHDQTALYRHFRRIVGVTPAALRQNPAQPLSVTQIRAQETLEKLRAYRMRGNDDAE